jgi:hypothetical protein
MACLTVAAVVAAALVVIFEVRAGSTPKLRTIAEAVAYQIGALISGIVSIRHGSDSCEEVGTQSSVRHVSLFRASRTGD